MAPRRTNSEGGPAGAAGAPPRPGSEPETAVRRAPFSDNPNVGARGQRTQQRILDAALRVFGEEGYHLCSIDRIAKRAGCSRVSFYQYFSGKEDVFRHLAGQVARQVSASTETLDPVTADAEGWTALRTWVARYGDIYERYEPMFQTFDTAAESDEAVAVGGARTAERYMARIRSRLATTTLPPRQLDPVITLLVECLTRSYYYAGVLRAAAPAAYPRDRMEDAVTDTMHRTLFGRRGRVNVHAPARSAPPALVLADEARAAFEEAGSLPDVTGAAERTLQALLEAGRDVFVSRGYHATRVDDIVAAAGLSHGAFYRYFDNKAVFGRALALRATYHVSTPFAEIPSVASDGPDGRGALRRWLRRFNAALADEAAMIRVWVDAMAQDPSLGGDAAPMIDWGRRRLARFLEPRGFGDGETDAVVMLALLDAFGARRRPPAMTEAAAHIIERGLLGE
jgi:AcrR family transcriptional regulator